MPFTRNIMPHCKYAQQARTVADKSIANICGQVFRSFPFDSFVWTSWRVVWLGHDCCEHIVHIFLLAFSEAPFIFHERAHANWLMVILSLRRTCRAYATWSVPSIAMRPAYSRIVSEASSFQLWGRSKIIQCIRNYLCNRQISFDSVLILLAPKYKYRSPLSSSIFSGNLVSRLPLRFSSLSVLILDLKHLGSVSLVSKLFFSIKRVSGQCWIKSCGNRVSPFALKSSTCKFVNFVNNCGGKMVSELWFRKIVSISVNLFTLCKCAKFAVRQLAVRPNRP